MADPLYINKDAVSSLPAYSANELRQAMALALMYDGRNMGGRKGVRPGGNQLQVSYAAPTITVQPGLCYVDPALSTPQGGYWVAIPAAETHTLTAADATNPRKDIMIARVYDHDEDASGLRLARTEYLVGTPNPAPSEPAVPAGAIKLALLDVPASPGAVVVTDRRPWTVAPGGILPVAAAGDIAAAVKGRYRDRLDTNVLERDSGAAWEVVADPAAFKAWTTWSPTYANLTIGNGTVTARYRQVGKTIDFRWRLALGSTSSVGTGPEFTLPAVAHSSWAQFDLAGDVDLQDSGVGARRGVLMLLTTVTASVGIMSFNGSGLATALSATSPHTWAAGDIIAARGTYEAA